MKKCTKCGLPMESKEDFCNRDESSDLCVHCCPKVNDKELDDPSKGNLG
jgi:hypothetical protein